MRMIRDDTHAVGLAAHVERASLKFLERLEPNLHERGDIDRCLFRRAL